MMMKRKKRSLKLSPTESGLKAGQEQLKNRSWTPLDVARDVLKCKRSELNAAIQERWCGDASDWCRLDVRDLPESTFQLLVLAADRQAKQDGACIDADVVKYWDAWVQLQLGQMERYISMVRTDYKRWLRAQTGEPPSINAGLDGLPAAARLGCESTARQLKRILTLLDARCPNPNYMKERREYLMKQREYIMTMRIENRSV
jgi:hypothetical protein